MGERTWETLASGCGLAEAPRVDAQGDVWFSDAFLGGVHRWSTATGEVTVEVPGRRGIGGLALHADGGVVVSGRDLVHVRDGEERVLLGGVEGVQGFNDLTTDPAGRVVVGALRFRPFDGDDPVPGELWRVGDEGAAAVAGDIDWPNGLGFSPDGDRLYASDYASGYLLSWEVDEDGVFHDRRVVAVTFSNEADGLAVDETGAVLVALGRGGGVGRYLPDGQLDGVLEVPTDFVSSVCFGGDDRRDLIVTTADNTEDPDRRGTVFRTRVDVPGLIPPLATV